MFSCHRLIELLQFSCALESNDKEKPHALKIEAKGFCHQSNQPKVRYILIIWVN